MLLKIVTRDLDTLSYARERNKILLEYVVGNSCLSEVLSCPGISAADNFTPYLCCFHIKGKLSTLEGRLADYGIPGLTWPGLPYKILTDEMLHHVAVNLERNKYFIPVNQPLDRRTVAKLLCFEQDAPEYEVAIAKWNGSSTDWNTLLSQVDFSNVLQTWEYGDAKALSEGWCVERFAISHRGRIIGCFQVLTKRYLGIISVNRINRGPLFLAGTRTKLQESAYLEIRRRFGKIQAGRLLFWAPESAFTGGNLAYFRHIGFHDRLSRGWCSSVIDLTSDVEVIQGRLNGKWRNSLRDAQRRNLVVTLSNSESDFTLFIDKCNETLSSRGVKFGRSLNLILRQLLKKQRDRDLHLIATAGGEVVASVYLVTHGVCATYLLGWNSSGGRDLRAHHLLLWEAIRQLKLRSIRSFDVGGVDEVTTPSIASFKLGLGGAQYRLVGEGLCY